MKTMTDKELEDAIDLAKRLRGPISNALLWTIDELKSAIELLENSSEAKGKDLDDSLLLIRSCLAAEDYDGIKRVLRRNGVVV